MIAPRPNNPYAVKAYDQNKNDVKIIYCSDIDNLESVMKDKEKEFSVVVIDEYLADEINSIENKVTRGKLDTVCMYFVIFQRDNEVRYHLGVNSVYEVVYDNGYKFIKSLKFNEISNIQSIMDHTPILVEDGKSGYKILRKYFDIPNIMEVIKADGNSKIPLKLTEHTNKKYICSLDYDKGSWVLYKIRKSINEGKLSADNISFISMESFEEIICNSKLLQDKNPELKELANNVEKYIDCSFQHRGEYFLTLIKRYFVDKFGDTHCKYTKKNVRYFIRECKDCKNLDCTFRQDSVEKVTIIFNNKYSIIYELYKKLKDEEKQ